MCNICNVNQLHSFLEYPEWSKKIYKIDAKFLLYYIQYNNYKNEVIFLYFKYENIYPDYLITLIII